MIEVTNAISWTTSSFLEKQQRVKRKGNLRWISQDKSRYYEWDNLHGEIEVYNKKGKHLMILNADGTLNNKKAIKGRTIDV